MQRTGKLPRHPPIFVSLIERACGETFLHLLWHFSACAFRPPVRYKMQRLSYPPHMSQRTLGVAAAFAFPMNSAHAAACSCDRGARRRPPGMPGRYAPSAHCATAHVLTARVAQVKQLEAQLACASGPVPPPPAAAVRTDPL